uniref:DUF4062 domain-containing protein n=1 Tax=Myripristis murdjan TaxID=586833 RepID=A0A667XZY0_9TELE
MCVCVCDSDTVAERGALMENVYPRLYAYCKQRGCDFRMVDLRWGVGDPVADRHDTVELHLDNLRRCQETHGANFVVRCHRFHMLKAGTLTSYSCGFDQAVNIANWYFGVLREA